MGNAEAELRITKDVSTTALERGPSAPTEHEEVHEEEDEHATDIDVVETKKGPGMDSLAHTSTLEDLEVLRSGTATVGGSEE